MLALPCSVPTAVEGHLLGVSVRVAGAGPAWRILGWAAAGAPGAFLAAGVSRRGAVCGPSSPAGVRLGGLALLRQML